MIPSSADPLLYYNPKIKVLDIKNVESLRESEIIVVPYTVDIYGFDYKSVLIATSYVQRDVKTVRGLSWETWTKETP